MGWAMPDSGASAVDERAKRRERVMGRVSVCMTWVVEWCIV